VCNYVGCNVYVKWFEHLADLSGSKLFMLDVPFCRTAEPSAADIQYVVAQLKELIALCESVSGKKFDIDELREILGYAARAEEGYARSKELCKRHPAPFDAYFDAINMMGPINVLRGMREGALFFDAAVAEFESLVAQGHGPLSEERFRTVVEGPPPYPFYKNSEPLRAVGRRRVQSTYPPWRHLGVGSVTTPAPAGVDRRADADENLTKRSIVARYAQIKRYVEEWEADALVIHSIKSCRLFSAGQGDMRDYFTQTLGVPTLMVESDLEDPRYYAEAQIKNRIDAFFESLEHKKLVAGRAAAAGEGI
jgi:benzoyl-CoA reductase subunit B